MGGPGKHSVDSDCTKSPLPRFSTIQRKKPAHMHLMLSGDDACLVHDKERARTKQQVRALAPSLKAAMRCSVSRTSRTVLFSDCSTICVSAVSSIKASQAETRAKEKGRRRLHWSALVVGSVQWQYLALLPIGKKCVSENNNIEVSVLSSPCSDFWVKMRFGLMS